MRQCLGVVWFVALLAAEPGPTLPGKPNFVVFLTDDQDLTLNGLAPMKSTLELIGNQGLFLANAFVNSPICCPSRSSILTGKFAHNLQVYNNSFSGGCSSRSFQENFERNSVTARLKRARNYQTFYAGKYLNQYGSAAAGGTRHVPAGYDWWLGLVGNSKYYNFILSENGTAVPYRETYLTDLITSKTLEFLDSRDVGRSFFAVLAPPAAHAPFTPAPRHSREFQGLGTPRKPPFNSTPADKHWLLQMSPKFLPSNVTILDEIFVNRWRTLLAVDEMVSAVITKLEKLGILKETYVIFMSDNGFHIGQFGQPWDKRQPYESDIRVPFLIRGPHIPAKTSLNYPISAVDLAPTILDLAGIQFGETDFDGVSLKNAIFRQSQEYGRDILVEYWGEGNGRSVDPACPWNRDDDLAECTLESWCKCQDSRNNTYACLLDLSPQKHTKFCRFSSGFIEIYDLLEDPAELRNLFRKTKKSQIFQYEERLRELQLQGNL